MSTFNEQVLLIGRDPDAPLGPFDGRTAAIIKDFVCTTPNQDLIFLPSLQRREVYLRSDVRYGPDDPTLWPQPWVAVYCHLGSIPRKPNDSNDPLAIMWWNPTPDDFKTFGDGSLVDGLGELSRSKFLSFKAMMTSLENRIEDYQKTSPKPNNLLLGITKAMQDAYTRLGSLKTTYSEMRFGVTEFQRYYLEVRGCLDYLEVYKPRMDGLKPAAETVANCVGAFTNIARVVQDFHTAGLPIWFLRPSTIWDTPVQCNILDIVPPLNPGDILCVSQHDPPYPPVFCGPATSPNRHAAIHIYSRMWLVFKDPFGGDSNALKPSATQSTDCSKISPPEASQSSARASKPRTDRDKFSPLDGPFAPYSIPAWKAALLEVDQSSSHLVETSKTWKYYGHFTFPDPGLFTHRATVAKYIESWLRIRDIWFMRVANEASLAMSNQTWRTFLSFDLDAPKKQTKAGRRCQESLNLLMPKSDRYPEVKIRSGLRGPFVWQGKEYNSGELPSDNAVRQILWELFQVNFIHELVSLDRRACATLDISNTSQLLERQIKVAQCFPPGSFGHPPIPSENSGLAADNLEERFRFITALLLVMESWRGNKPIAFQIPIDKFRDYSRQGIRHVEKVVARYYCQQFFNYFGRAAQIPHRLFATNDD